MTHVEFVKAKEVCHQRTAKFSQHGGRGMGDQKELWYLSGPFRGLVPVIVFRLQRSTVGAFLVPLNEPKEI